MLYSMNRFADVKEKQAHVYARTLETFSTDNSLTPINLVR